ncbi:MAG: hypothetical protein AB7P23_02855 [Amphiplicatus sp.]
MTQRVDKAASTRSSAEGVLVGQMLCAYGEIEYELISLLSLITDQAPLHLKTIFKLRRRRERLEVIDAVARAKFIEIGLGAKYVQAIDAVDCCRTLFSQYDSCHWFRRDGRLCFVDLEEFADGRAAPAAGFEDSGGAYATDAELLGEQTNYFDYARLCLAHLRREIEGGAERRGPMPPKRIRPPLHRGAINDDALYGLPALRPALRNGKARRVRRGR